MTSCYNLVTVVIDNFIIPYKKKIDLSQCRVQGGGQLPDQIGALLYILAPLLSARPYQIGALFYDLEPLFFPFFPSPPFSPFSPPFFPFLPIFALFPLFLFPPFFWHPLSPFFDIKDWGGIDRMTMFPFFIVESDIFWKMQWTHRDVFFLSFIGAHFVWKNS